MKIQVLPPARAELVDAATYYEQEEHGLGWRLWQEVDANIRWIQQNPLVLRQRPGGYRRINLKTFPYFVAYIVRGETVWVLAIANAQRQPEYWIGRMKGMG